MYKRKTNRKKTGILTEIERDYLCNPAGTTKNNQGNIKKNIDKKALELDIYDLSFDLRHLLSEEKIITLTRELIYSLPTEKRKIFFEEHKRIIKNNYNTEMYNKIKFKESKRFKKILKKTGTKNLTLGEIHFLERLNKKNSLNETQLKKEANRLYKSETFILRRKLQSDIKFILDKEERLKVFRFIYRTSKSFRLDLLFKKFPDKKYSYFIKQFYERGIIIPAEKSKKDFISICRANIKNKKAKEISKFFQEYEIYPLVFRNNKLKERVKLNPYYDYFRYSQKDFQKGSSIYYTLAVPLRSLLIDDPNDCPEEFYPSVKKSKNQRIVTTYDRIKNLSF